MKNMVELGQALTCGTLFFRENQHFIEKLDQGMGIVFKRKLPAGSTSLDLTGSKSDDKVSNEAILSLARPDKASICIYFCFPSSGICICKRYLCETMVPQPCSLAML